MGQYGVYSRSRRFARVAGQHVGPAAPWPTIPRAPLWTTPARTPSIRAICGACSMNDLTYSRNGIASHHFVQHRPRQISRPYSKTRSPTSDRGLCTTPYSKTRATTATRASNDGGRRNRSSTWRRRPPVGRRRPSSRTRRQTER